MAKKRNFDLFNQMQAEVYYTKQRKLLTNMWFRWEERSRESMSWSNCSARRLWRRAYCSPGKDEL